MSPTPKLHPAVAALIAIVLVSTATAAVIAVNNQSKTTKINSPASASVPSTDTSATADSSSSSAGVTTDGSYKDGQYTAATTYRTPGGAEQISVTLTVAGNTINAVDISQQGDSRESKEYQSMFAGAYQSHVVGKKIGEVNLSRIAGASLTSGGFNDALEQIKQDAAA